MIVTWLARRLRWPSVRAVRGATTVTANDAEAIREAVLELIAALRERNRLHDGEVISAIFTMTPDLTAAFPAEAARLAGWHDVPLLCTTEIAVPRALPRCLRILLHVQRSWRLPPVPVYLRGAAALRPDLAAASAGIAFRPQHVQHPPHRVGVP